MFDRFMQDTLFNRVFVAFPWYGLLLVAIFGDYLLTLLWLFLIIFFGNYESCVLHRVPINQIMRENLLVAIAANLIWGVIFLWHIIWSTLAPQWSELLLNSLPVLLSYKLFCIAISISAMIWNRQELNKAAVSSLLAMIPLECMIISYYVPELWQNTSYILNSFLLIYLSFFAVMLFFVFISGNKLRAEVARDNNRYNLVSEMYPEFQIWFLLCMLIAVFGLGFAQLAMYNRYALFFTVLILTVNDISGYFVGKAVGGRKIYPAISPYKTYAGSIAGVVFSLLIVLLASIFGASMSYMPLMASITSPFAAKIYLLVYTLIISCLSQGGDWFLSYLKRRINSKNTGALLMSHGGLWDRLDSMVMPVILTWLMFLIFS